VSRQPSKEETCEDDIVMYAARFILNLKEKFRLSQVSLDFVITSVEELIKLSAANFRNQILTTLHQDGVEEAALLSDHIFSSLNPLKPSTSRPNFIKKISIWL